MKRPAWLGLAVGIALWGVAAVASAGPIIISGTDADDHGSVLAAVNQTGWFYMQKAFENVAPQVSNGNKLAVCLGCNAGQAQNAFASAFDLSNLPAAGWTRISLTSVADITNFMTNAGAGTKISQAGIIYMPTADGNVGGGISGAQLAPVNANAAALNAYVAAGGGLFTQDQNPNNISGGQGYGWLTTLLPGIVVHGDNDGTIANSGSLTLTPAGSAAFPGLTDPILSAATPWHDWFSGSFGGLGVLVTGPASPPGVTVIPGAVVLGGGGATVIVCGQPGAPPCPTGTPEPATLLLLGSGLIVLGGFAWSRRHKKL
jgi:PEP-CTERM motif